MSRIPSLQDPFLNSLRKEKIPLFIFLLNGIKLKGIVEAFDQFSIILRNSEDHITQMIYKHAISTIVPTRAVRFVYSNYNPNHSTNSQQPSSIISNEDDDVKKQYPTNSIQTCKDDPSASIDIDQNNSNKNVVIENNNCSNN